MTDDSASKKEKSPWEPREFLASYKLPDNSGQRAGIFQELEEDQPVFLFVQDSCVVCSHLRKSEINYIEMIGAKEGVEVTDQDILESAATTLMKVGINYSWDEESKKRIFTILDLPPESTVEIVEKAEEDE